MISNDRTCDGFCTGILTSPPTNQNLYGSVNNNIFRVWEQRSQVFIGYGRIPSSTLYDNVEACPHESRAFFFGSWVIENKSII